MRKLLILIVLTLCVSAVLIPTASSSATIRYNGSPYDGYLSYTNATYQFAHDRISATTTDSSNSRLYVGQAAGWTIYRSFVYFNTSGIPDGATIYQATLHMYAETVVHPTSIHILQDTIHGCPHVPLVANDYQISEYGNHIGGFLYSWDISTTGWHDIVIYDWLSVPDLVISKTGWTKFALVSDADFNANPVVNGPVYLTSANGGANAPYITVTYNQKPATPSTPSGAAEVYKNYPYSLRFSTTDPENNQVKYDVDWGDGLLNIQHTGFYPSGQIVTLSHKYGGNGLETIKVRAVDNDTNGMPDWTDWSAGAVVNVTTKVIVNYEDIVAAMLDPDQKIDRVYGKVVDDAGLKNLLVWWTLNDAASAQGDLQILVTLESANGSRVLFEGYARDHMSEDKAVTLAGFDVTNKGWDFWNFDIKAELTNPAEPYKCDKGDNTAVVYMFLGMWVYLDFMFFGIIAAIIIVIILLIYKGRRWIFHKWYDKYKYDEETKKMKLDEEGNMPGILMRLADSRNYWKQKAMNVPARVLAPNPNIGKDLYRSVKNVASYVPGAPFVYSGLNKRAGKVQKWWKDMPPDVGNRMLTRMANMNEQQARKTAMATRDKLVGAMNDYYKSGRKMPKEMKKDMKRAIVAIDNRFYPKSHRMVYIKKKDGGYWKPKTSLGRYPMMPMHFAAKSIKHGVEKGENKAAWASIYGALEKREELAKKPGLKFFSGPSSEKKGRVGRRKVKKETQHTEMWSPQWHWAKSGEKLFDVDGKFIGLASGDRFYYNPDGSIVKDATTGNNIVKTWEAVPKRNDNGSIDDLEFHKNKIELKMGTSHSFRGIKKAFKREVKSYQSGEKGLRDLAARGNRVIDMTLRENVHPAEPIRLKETAGNKPRRIKIETTRGTKQKKAVAVTEGGSKKGELGGDRAEFEKEAKDYLDFTHVTDRIYQSKMPQEEKDKLYNEKLNYAVDKLRKEKKKFVDKYKKGKNRILGNDEMVRAEAKQRGGKDYEEYVTRTLPFHSDKTAFHVHNLRNEITDREKKGVRKSRLDENRKIGATATELTRLYKMHHYPVNSALEKKVKKAALKMLTDLRKQDPGRYEYEIKRYSEDPRYMQLSLIDMARSRVNPVKSRGGTDKKKYLEAETNEEESGGEKEAQRGDKGNVKYRRRQKKVSWFFNSPKKRHAQKHRINYKKRQVPKRKKTIRYKRRVKRVRITQRKPHRQKVNMKRRISWF